MEAKEGRNAGKEAAENNAKNAWDQLSRGAETIATDYQDNLLALDQKGQTEHDALVEKYQQERDALEEKFAKARADLSSQLEDQKTNLEQDARAKLEQNHQDKIDFLLNDDQHEKAEAERFTFSHLSEALKGKNHDKTLVQLARWGGEGEPSVALLQQLFPQEMTFAPVAPVTPVTKEELAEARKKEQYSDGKYKAAEIIKARKEKEAADKKAQKQLEKEAKTDFLKRRLEAAGFASRLKDELARLDQEGGEIFPDLIVKDDKASSFDASAEDGPSVTEPGVNKNYDALKTQTPASGEGQPAPKADPTELNLHIKDHEGEDAREVYIADVVAWAEKVKIKAKNSFGELSDETIPKLKILLGSENFATQDKAERDASYRSWYESLPDAMRRQISFDTDLRKNQNFIVPLGKDLRKWLKDNQERVDLELDRKQAEHVPALADFESAAAFRADFSSWVDNLRSQFNDLYKKEYLDQPDPERKRDALASRTEIENILTGADNYAHPKVEEMAQPDPGAENTDEDNNLSVWYSTLSKTEQDQIHWDDYPSKTAWFNSLSQEAQDAYTAKWRDYSYSLWYLSLPGSIRERLSTDNRLRHEKDIIVPANQDLKLWLRTRTEAVVAREKATGSEPEPLLDELLKDENFTGRPLSQNVDAYLSYFDWSMKNRQKEVTGDFGADGFDIMSGKIENTFHDNAERERFYAHWWDNLSDVSKSVISLRLSDRHSRMKIVPQNQNFIAWLKDTGRRAY